MIDHQADYQLVDRAIDQRLPLIADNASHKAAMRLFNGFYEGLPHLVIDLYASTLLFHLYDESLDPWQAFLTHLITAIQKKFPFITCAIGKIRHSPHAEQRNGVILWGGEPASQIVENGITYKINLRLHQDTSFYLDTAELRRWLRSAMSGKTILNTFAYTGSLGVAALAGGAARVLHTDANRSYLQLAKESAELNHFATRKQDYLVGDFFRVVQQLKITGSLFDAILLDPPFFSLSGAGKVDQLQDSKRLINKVRPLVHDQGFVIAVNNALYLPGASFYTQVEELCEVPYLSIEQIIPIPEHVTGYPATIVSQPPVSPAPFNHPTKIVVLKVRRKNLL